MDKGEFLNPYSFFDLRSLVRDLGFDAVNSLRYWSHNVQGNRVEKKYFSGESKHPPVILLQGFLGTRGVLKPLENHLRETGRDVISLDLGFFNVRDIRKSSQILSYKMERILDRFAKEHSLEKIDIIGHSMGGLIGLYYVKRLGGHRIVRKMITLGAPFQGTWMSVLGLIPWGIFAKGVWQMIPGSEFLKSLEARPSEIHETKVFSLAAKFDTICPPSSCKLEGATNKVIPVGHAGLLMDKRVFDTIVDYLNSGPAHEKVVSFKRPK